jgi:hypothetical protein
MDPLAKIFKPNQTKHFPIQTKHLTVAEENIFQEILYKWTNTPTLNLLLDNWSVYRDKTLPLMNTQRNLSLLLLNTTSLNRYLVDVFHLIDSTAPPIVILNGTHHDEDCIKRFTAHFFNFPVYSMKGSNRFGGVLILRKHSYIM